MGYKSISVDVDIDVDDILDGLSDDDLREELKRRDEHKGKGKKTRNGKLYDITATTMLETQILDQIVRLVESPATDRVSLLTYLESL